MTEGTSTEDDSSSSEIASNSSTDRAGSTTTDVASSGSSSSAIQCAVTTDCPSGEACGASGTCGTACSETAVCNGGCCNAGECAAGTALDACGAGGACSDCTCPAAGPPFGYPWGCDSTCSAAGVCHGTATFLPQLSSGGSVNYGGGPFIVPGGVAEVTVTATGGGGGICQVDSAGGNCGAAEGSPTRGGTTVTATFIVTPNQSLDVVTGAPGCCFGGFASVSGAAGGNGDGTSQYPYWTAGGSGGTAARVTAPDWLLVAGATGGGGGLAEGENGGQQCPRDGGFPGLTTLPSGGSGADGADGGAPGDGSAPGNGSTGGSGIAGGGGGGGGYVAGGGGGACGGGTEAAGCYQCSGGAGGTGSSYVSGGTNVTIDTTLSQYPGVTITW